MDEVVVGGEDTGASSSTAGVDLEDSLPQPPSIPLVESIDEALVPDMIAGTTGTSSVFQVYCFHHGMTWVFDDIYHK